MQMRMEKKKTESTCNKSISVLNFENPKRDKSHNLYGINWASGRITSLAPYRASVSYSNGHRHGSGIRRKQKKLNKSRIFYSY